MKVNLCGFRNLWDESWYASLSLSLTHIWHMFLSLTHANPCTGTHPRSMKSRGMRFMCHGPWWYFMVHEAPCWDFPQNTITQFRQISLCNVIYKVLTKVLVNRIKPFFSSIVNITQASFIPQRQVADNIFLARRSSTASKVQRERKVIWFLNSISKKHLIKFIGNFLLML